jgi:hypothetical protein
MFQLKPISPDGVPAALQKADRYRLINDPSSAESIYLDVLRLDPEHQSAVIGLLLAITDQFAEGPAEGVRRAQELLPRITDPYQRAYHTGIVCERCGKAQLHRAVPGASSLAYDWFRKAMDSYEQAEALRPAGHDEAILRWNTCARLLENLPQLGPEDAESLEPSLE